jgi:hypothetical protein
LWCGHLACTRPQAASRASVLRDAGCARAQQEPHDNLGTGIIVVMAGIDWSGEAWAAAYRRLVERLPLTPALIDGPAAMVVDAVLEVAEASGVPFTSVLMYNPWRAVPEGRGTKSWEDYTDEEAFDATFADAPPAPGPLWFILRRQESEPIVVGEGQSLREVALASGCDLRDDTIFLWCELPLITVIHHEGMFCHVDVSRRR